MRSPRASLLVVLAVAIAACGGVAADSTTTSVTEAPTSTASPAPEAVLLSYDLEAGTSMTYEVDFDQHFDMTTTGDSSAMGDEGLPGAATFSITGTTTFTHSIEDGPEAGTYAVTITGDFSGMHITGVIDGEEIDSDEIPEFATMEPVEVTVIVDEQGNVIPGDDEALGDLFGGDMGGLGGLGDFGSAGGDLGRFVGPPLSDREVTVGDVWSETIRTPLLFEGEEISTEIVNEVTASETLDGVEVFVIETTTTTSALEFDLAEILIGFMTAFLPEDATDEEKAEMEALTEQMKFLLSVDETVAEMTTWFDPAAGMARKADYASATRVVMDINMPDEATEELVSFGMEMTIDQQVSYRLVSSTSA